MKILNKERSSLLPLSDQSRSSRWPFHSPAGLVARYAALSVLGLVVITLSLTGISDDSAFYVSRPTTALSNSPSASSRCPQPSPHAPAKGAEYFTSEEFLQLSVRRLSGAIRVPTMSFDDLRNPMAVPLDPRWLPFEKLHDFLESEYPLVHAHLVRTKVSRYSLVYTWPGSDPSLPPTMLTGHLDVVPALTALSRWTYPPFEGHYDGTWMWGRGASDCKNNVIGILSTVERLLELDFKPRRTVVLAFGQDEEASGRWGARFIADHLEGLYGRHGVAIIVDEGGSGLEFKYGRDFALPGVAEKGYADIRITVNTLGGHSSTPLAHTSIGYLSRMITAVEDARIYRPVLTPSSPIYRYLECLVEHGDPKDLPRWLPKGLSSGDLDEVAERLSEIWGKSFRFMLETSKAATMVEGGVKVNALPEEASVVFNSRVQPASSIEEHQALVSKVILPVAERYNLSVNDFGRRKLESPEFSGNVHLELVQSDDPSPITPFEGEVWDIFATAVRSTYGENLVVAPSLMTGNTDTQKYHNVSQNIFRWSPARVGTRLNAHTIDERVMMSTHVDGARFYYELILAMDGF